MANNSPFFKQILQLEKQVLEGLQHSDFCDVSASALSEFDFASFEGMKSLREALPCTKSVTQFYSPNGFGKCNVTLVNNGKFFILAMFMDDLSTEIHDHGFEGVFAPLKGNPVQLEFSFSSQERLSDHIERGELICSNYKVLSPGLVTKLEKGLIHMLERPVGNQFSLLVCRHLTGTARLNYFYLYPGLKIKNRDGGAYLPRLISVLQSDSRLQSSEVDLLLGSLERDELIQLFFRVGPELADKALERNDIKLIREFARRELVKSELWHYVDSHIAFLQNSKHKTSILVL